MLSKVSYLTIIAFACACDGNSDSAIHSQQGALDTAINKVGACQYRTQYGEASTSLCHDYRSCLELAQKMDGDNEETILEDDGRHVNWDIEREKPASCQAYQPTGACRYRVDYDETPTSLCHNLKQCIELGKKMDGDDDRSILFNDGRHVYWSVSMDRPQSCARHIPTGACRYRVDYDETPTSLCHNLKQCIELGKKMDGDDDRSILFNDGRHVYWNVAMDSPSSCNK